MGKNPNIKSILLGFTAGTLLFAVVVGGGALWQNVRAAVGSSPAVITMSGVVRGVLSPLNGNDVATRGFVEALPSDLVAFRSAVTGTLCPDVSGVTCRFRLENNVDGGHSGLVSTFVASCNSTGGIAGGVSACVYSSR